MTQPMSAVAHDDRDEGVQHEGEERPAPGGVLELAFDRRPVDALHAVEGDAEREQDADQHPDVEQAQPLDLERRDVLRAGGGREVGAEGLERLALVLDALGEPGGERGRLHHGDDRADAVLAERVDRRRDGALVAHELRGQHDQCGAVAVEPDTAHRSHRPR